VAATAEEAVDRLRKVRPSIIVRPEAMEALRTLDAMRSAETGAADDINQQQLQAVRPWCGQ